MNPVHPAGGARFDSRWHTDGQEIGQGIELHHRERGHEWSDRRTRRSVSQNRSSACRGWSPGGGVIMIRFRNVLQKDRFSEG